MKSLKTDSDLIIKDNKSLKQQNEYQRIQILKSQASRTNLMSPQQSEKNKNSQKNNGNPKNP